MRIEIAILALAAALVGPSSLDGERTPPQEATVDATTDLDALEQRLADEPDSLEAGNRYRLAVIRGRQYDRCLAFFDRLVAYHPDAANAHLNYGFAYVDKIPTVGAVRQVILANSALGEFTRAVELNPTWVTYYTRGTGYLFWPPIFGRAPLGIADLEHALDLQRGKTLRSYHVRAFISLGDGYWRLHRPDRARELWAEGARLFPDNHALKSRLSADAERLTTIIDDAFDPTRRVDTDLRELWSQP